MDFVLAFYIEALSLKRNKIVPYKQFYLVIYY